MEKILEHIPADFPITARPYKEMAGKMGIGEEELIEGLKTLKESGVIRRVAGALSHRKIAYEHNAMVVWRVEERDVDTVGARFAAFDEVSHCYERGTGGYWSYNLYTMVHGRNREGCMKSIEKMAHTGGISEYRVLFSKREFKKTSFTVAHE
jgi:siroheme decarboxylase